LPDVEIRIVGGPDTGRSFTLADEVVIGRDADAGVTLNDPEASRRHARISLRDAEPVIADLGSTNGTFVNEARLSAPHRLASGDKVRIGDTVLQVSRPVTLAAPVGRLAIVSGPGAGETLDVVRPATIGRDARGALVIPDPEVSREHVRIAPDDGQAVIVDIGATNGTFVNGERLIGHRRLVSGDQLEVGQAVLQYSGAGERPQPTVARPQVTTLREIRARPEEATASRKWWTLGVVCAAVAMLFLDTTIVSVALPAITTGLNASFAELQWLIGAYALTLAVALLTSGTLADRFGRRRLFVLGIGVFTVFSLACGLARSAVLLDAFRAAQGIGGAMMLATSLALIAQEFPPGERAVAYGAWGATSGAAAATGPLVGGLLTSALGWPWIFYVNVPIGIVVLVISLRKLVNLPGPATAIDVPGLVTFSASMFLLVYGLIRGNDDGWGSTTIIGCLAGSVVLGVLFVIVELRQSDPMLPLELFRIPTTIGTALAGFALAATVTGVLPYTTLWMQSILGESAVGTGVRLLPLSVAALVLSPTLGRLEKWVAPGLMVAAGFVAYAIGFLLMGRVNASSGWTVLLPGFILLGVGLGFQNIPLEGAAVGVVPPWQSGLAAGVYTTFRQIGLAAGIAGLGAVLQTAILTNVRGSLARTPFAHRATELAASVASGGTRGVLARLPPSVRPLFHHTASVAYSAGLSKACIICAVVAAVAAITSVVLVRRRDMFEAAVVRTDA
jgi:EmrB/QacA subfamily drug resistance transporter